MDPLPDSSGRFQGNSRWLAIDVGTRRIGVAVSDPLRITARPLCTLERDGSETMRLLEIISELSIQCLIVGVPLRLTGEESEQSLLVRAFVENLRSELPIPVITVDERLSSKEAEATMASQGIRADQRRGRRDEFAAALILQWYLEEIREER